MNQLDKVEFSEDERFLLLRIPEEIKCIKELLVEIQSIMLRCTIEDMPTRTTVYFSQWNSFNINRQGKRNIFVMSPVSITINIGQNGSAGQIGLTANNWICLPYMESTSIYNSSGGVNMIPLFVVCTNQIIP